MKTIKTKNYNIYINPSDYCELAKNINLNKYSSVFVIVDNITEKKCLPKLLGSLLINCDFTVIKLDSGESNKNIISCELIWSVLSNKNGDRKSLIINLGGGVVSDIGGFCAATFKRGIDFINIPTTLLSMVDASIGGKTGIDLGSLKNQIGVFCEPQAVIIDVNFLKTLDDRQIRSGYAEMLKHGLIASKFYWQELIELKNIYSDDLSNYIVKSINIKNNIVKADFLENGKRKSLNFGHTIGHAIESYYLINDKNIELLHGEAIAIGMIIESNISTQLGFLTQGEYLIIRKKIMSIYKPFSFSMSDVYKIIELLIHDKKYEYGKSRFVLLKSIGDFVINQEVETPLIINAFEDFNMNVINS